MLTTEFDDVLGALNGRSERMTTQNTMLPAITSGGTTPKGLFMVLTNEDRPKETQRNASPWVQRPGLSDWTTDL